MLFCYSPAATAENWLHECLIAMITAALDAIDAGNKPTAWPQCIPPLYRDELKNRTALRGKIEAFAEAARQLATDERQAIREAIQKQNDFPANLSAKISCVPVDDLPSLVRKPAKDLGRAAFDLLTSLGVRDRHYEIIYKALPLRVCPFCGFEPFDAPGAPRHDLDHYILMSKYPFASANLKNLAPMGDRCNSAYKWQKDVLVDDAGAHRISFDPYGSKFASVSLAQSQLFGSEAFAPDWIISVGQNDEAMTWDSVWRISERYRRDVLIPDVQGWLDEFGAWCLADNRDVSTRPRLIEVLEKYVANLNRQGLSERAFLKREVFALFLTLVQSSAVADRATKFLQNVAKSPVLT